MKTYNIYESDCPDVASITAATAEAALDKYAEGITTSAYFNTAFEDKYGETYYIHLRAVAEIVWYEDDDTDHEYPQYDEDEDDTAERTIELEPPEPDCYPGYKHEWMEYGAAGFGITTIGRGGGVEHREVCLWCGTIKHDSNWVRNPNDGTENNHGVWYSEATGDTAEWAEYNRDREEDEENDDD